MVRRSLCACFVRLSLIFMCPRICVYNVTPAYLFDVSLSLRREDLGIEDSLLFLMRNQLVPKFDRTTNYLVKLTYLIDRH